MSYSAHLLLLYFYYKCSKTICDTSYIQLNCMYLFSYLLFCILHRGKELKTLCLSTQHLNYFWRLFRELPHMVTKFHHQASDQVFLCNAFNPSLSYHMSSKSTQSILYITPNYTHSNPLKSEHHILDSDMT